MGHARPAFAPPSAARGCQLLGVRHAGALGAAMGPAGLAIARPSTARACRLLGLGTAQARWASRGACRSNDRSALGCSCLWVARSRERAGALATAAGLVGTTVFRSSAALACLLLGVGDAGPAKAAPSRGVSPGRAWCAERSAASRASEWRWSPERWVQMGCASLRLRDGLSGKFSELGSVAQFHQCLVAERPRVRAGLPSVTRQGQRSEVRGPVS